MTAPCPSNMEEIWKPIPGYEGLYEASSAGRIRSAYGKTTSSARYPVRVWKQRILKPKVQTKADGRQDQHIDLWKKGKPKTYLVARLVAMAFLPAPFEQLTVNHINGDSMDNRIENLEWCTVKENVKHAFATGLQLNSQSPVFLIDKTGQKMGFNSMSEADRYLGKCHGYVSGRLKRGHPKVYSANNEPFEAIVAL